MRLLRDNSGAQNGIAKVPTNGPAGRLSAVTEHLRNVCASVANEDACAAIRRSVAAREPLPYGRWEVCDCFPLCGYQYVVLRLRPFSSTAVRQGPLSGRERTVARLAARGEPLKVIADNCAISLQAVSTYLTRAKRKLGVASRTELARAMIQDEGEKGSPADPHPVPAAGYYKQPPAFHQ